MIEVQNLEKKFGKFTAVDKISFSLKAGDVLGFLGPNGAGKSTTMKMLSGYLPPTNGSVTIQNKDVFTQAEKTSELIGYLPETVPLYKDMTVREFLGFVVDIRRLENPKDKIKKILKTTFLEEVADQIIGTLSKGYRQRVGFAQAIIHNPPFLILDEPTDGLDPNQKSEVREIIKSLSKNKGIILSTHILEEMEAVCNRVIIIDSGKIIIDTTPEELLQKSPNYNNIRIYFKEPVKATLQRDLKSIVGVKNVTSINDKEFVIEPEGKSDLFLKILTLLKAKKMEINAISMRQGKADEVFRNLTITK